MTSRELLGLVLLAGSVLAQTNASEPRSNLPDSMPREDKVVYRPAKSAGKAVLLSFLLPGGGQVYTGNWWKAALIAPAEVTLGYFSVKEHMAATEALNSGDTTGSGYVLHRDRRTALLWWTGAVLAFSMADAYVSAQMYGFDREMRFVIGPTRTGIAVEF